MDDVTRLAVFGGVAPLVVAAGFIAPGRGPGERERERHAWRFPVGLALPIVAAVLVLYGWPQDKFQRLTWIPAAGLIVGVVMSCSPRSFWLRLLLFAALGGACLLLLWPVLQTENMLFKAAPVVGVAALAAAMEPLATRRPGAVVPVAVLVAMTTATAICIKSGSVKLPTPLVTATVTFGICAIAPIWKRGFVIADGPLAVVMPMLVTTPIVAYLYSTFDPFPIVCFVLPAAAPLLVWIGEIGPLRRRPAVAAAVSLTLVVAVCAAAVLLTQTGAAEDEMDDPMMQMYEEMMGQ